MNSLCAVALVLSASALPQARSLPQMSGGRIILAVDPAKSDVHWTLGSTLHTVHGTFVVSRGLIQVEPATGKARGEIVVDARTGESGNESRDKKMRKDVLESAKFAQIVFRPERIDGKLLRGATTSTVRLRGVFLLHGQEHEMDIPVVATIDDDRWTGTASFTVPYIQWGLKDPSNFMLKVRPEVEIEIKLAGAAQKAAQ
jgi:polyisoprenoid-binding protein YceI